MRNDSLMENLHDEENRHRFELSVHPNGQYWQVVDTSTDYRFAKQEAVDCLNRWYDEYMLVSRLFRRRDKELSDLHRVLDEPLFIVENPDKVWRWDEGFNVKRTTFYDMIMKQQGMIEELEQTVMDLEWEVESLNSENMRLRGEKIIND